MSNLPMNKHQIRSARTRQHIMDTAEPLFAEYGLDGVSMRQIATAAGADLSLLMYHFESKLNLYCKIVDRLLVSFTNEKIAMLDDLESRTENPTVVELFDVMATLWLEMHFGPRRNQLKLLIRGLHPYVHPHDEAEERSDAATHRFLNAIQKAAPEVSAERIHWIYHGFVGALILFLDANCRAQRISKGICDMNSPKAVRRALLDFVRDSFRIGNGGAEQGRKLNGPRSARA